MPSFISISIHLLLQRVFLLRRARLKVLFLGFVSLPFFAACGIIGESGTTQAGTNDYQDAQEVERMQFPAGTDDSAIIDYFPVPPLSPEADSEMLDREQLPYPTAISNRLENLVELQSLAGQYWVLNKAVPNQSWARLKQFMDENNLEVIYESPADGLIAVKTAESHTSYINFKQNLLYQFKIAQGIQRKSSEIFARVQTLDLQAEQGSWPKQSSNIQAELKALELLTLFLSEYESQSAYSYAALGIAEKQRLSLQQDQSTGLKQVNIQADFERSRASLKQALNIADFIIVDDTLPNSISAQYMPKLAEDEQPGFFLRLFGVEPKLFDKDVEFAGNQYVFSIHSVSNTEQLINVKLEYIFNKKDEKRFKKDNAAKLASDGNLERMAELSPSSLKRESNHILMLIKRNLY